MKGKATVQMIKSPCASLQLNSTKKQNFWVKSFINQCSHLFELTFTISKSNNGSLKEREEVKRMNLTANFYI